MAEIVIVESATQGGAVGASIIEQVVRTDAAAVLGVATGSTPLELYASLSASRRRAPQSGTRDGSAGRPIDFSHVTVFALDEYVGLVPGHPESYRSIVEREVATPLGIDPRRVHVPNGDPEQLAGAGRAYEEAIEAVGGIDVQILGIGTDGHIGFNEPGSSLASLTRVKTLTPQTRLDNARFFASVDEVPMHCVTQGIGTILRAEHLVLLAFGASKAAAVAGAVEGAVTSSLPASAIQLHPHVTVIVDEAAAAELTREEYYRYVYANRPVWQTF